MCAQEKMSSLRLCVCVCVRANVCGRKTLLAVKSKGRACESRGIRERNEETVRKWTR